MTRNRSEGFIEADYYQFYKQGNKIGGDVFLLSRAEQSGRVICVLSDGLGSGVKANVLAKLTATMAAKYIAGEFDVRRAAETIMRTLPVCKERKISYATFSIIDIQPDGRAQIVEYDNPRFLYFRENRVLQLERGEIELPRRFEHKAERLYHSHVTLKIGDRLVFYSDGVTQSGMGTAAHPLGLRDSGTVALTSSLLRDNPSLSAGELARRIALEARKYDSYQPKDDITCGVIYLREPRTALIATGPPTDSRRDPGLAEKLNSFTGKRVICGGTTAQLVARELGREIKVDLSSRNRRVPPAASMNGMDLVTEGMLTLAETASLLEKREGMDDSKQHAAVRLCRLLIESDKLLFLVGTRINEAHQDPDMPIEIGIRRTLVQRICRILEKQYLKETRIEYI